MTFCEMHKPSGCPECPNRYVCKDSTLLQERHQRDLANDKMVWVRFPDSPVCRHLTMTEFDLAKTEFNKAAIEKQRESGADCVIYATKTYNKDGSIRTAGLCIIPLTMAEYEKRTENLGNEQVYTVYKR